MKTLLQVFASNVLSKGLIGLSGLAIIHHLPAADYALYTLGFALVSLGAQLVSGPLNIIYIVALRSGHPAIAPTPFFILQMAALAAVLLLGLPLAALTGWLYAPIALWVAAMVGFEFSRTRLQSDLDFGRYNGYEIARAALTFGGVWAVCQLPTAGPATLMALQGAVMLAVTVLSLAPHLKKSQIPDSAATLRAFRDLAARYPALVGYCVLLALFTQMDVLFLKALADEHTLATYGSALRYYQLLVMALASANTVLFPQVSRAKTGAQIVTLYRSHLKVSAVFLGLAAAAAAVAPFVMPIVDQGRYPQAVPTFGVLAVSAGVSFVCAPFVNVLLRQGQFRILLVTLLVAMAVGAVLQAVLIPLWGSVGAAVATLTSSAILTLQCFRVARRTLTSLKEAP